MCTRMCTCSVKLPTTGSTVSQHCSGTCCAVSTDTQQPPGVSTDHPQALRAIFILQLMTGTHHKIHEHYWHEEEKDEQENVNIYSKGIQLFLGEVVLDVLYFTQCHDEDIDKPCPHSAKSILQCKTFKKPCSHSPKSIAQCKTLTSPVHMVPNASCKLRRHCLVLFICPWQVFRTFQFLY